MRVILSAAFVLITSSAHAALNFTADSLGSKNTEPGKLFDLSSSTQNVILQLRVNNNTGASRSITKTTVTFTNTTSTASISAGSIRLIHDEDGSLATTIDQSTTVATGFNGLKAFWDGLALPIPNNTTQYLFIVYDSSTTQQDNAVIDARLESTADVTGTSGVVINFNDGSFEDSAGQDTVTIVASTYSINTIANQTAGTSFSATVRAIDSFGNLDLDASALTRITTATADAAATSPGGFGPVYPGNSALTNGQHVFSGITLYSAATAVRVGAEWVSGSPNLSGAGVVNSNAFQVAHTTAALKIQTISSPQTAGTPFNVFVNASSDTYGNLVAASALTNRELAVNGGSEPPLTSPFSFVPVYGATQTFGVTSGLVYVGTFSVTLFDFDPDVNLSAQDPTGILTSTQSVLFAVDAAAVNAFSMDTITSTPIAGVTFPVIVRVSDQYGNSDGATLSGTPMVLQGANDSSAPNSALTGQTPDYPSTFNWTGQSSTTLNVTLYARENARRLRARSNPEGTIQTSTSNFFNIWAATTTTRYEFATVPALTAGLLHQTTVTVRDAFRNIVASPNFSNLAGQQLALGSNATAAPGGQTPIYEATYTWTGAENGQTLMDVTLFRVQTATAILTANDPNGGVIASTQSAGFSVQHGTAAQMGIDTLAQAEAGDAFSVFVRISSDTYGNAGIPLGNYSGAAVQLGGAAGFAPSNSVADSQAGAQSPSYSGAQTWGAGGVVSVATFTVTLKHVETGRRLSATESGATGKIAAATSNSFDVTHCSTDHIHVDVPANAVAGVAFVSTVTVHDPYNNVVQDYAGTFQWQAVPAAGGNVLPGNGSPTNGILTGSVTLVTVGVSSINVTDISIPALTSTDTVTVDFSAGRFLKLAVSTNQVAGTAFGSTVTVTDDFNNQYTPYAGMLTYASNDPQFVSPVVSTTAPNGQKFLSGFILKTAGNRTYGVSDNAGSTSTSTVIGVSLSAGRFVNLTIATSATSGVALSPTVRIIDDYANLDTASTSTIRVTSSDTGATLPPDTALIAGQANLSLTLFDQGNQTVTAQSLNSVATSTTNTVDVGFSAGRFLKLTVSTSQVAGTAFGSTVTVTDDFNNQYTPYGGTVTYASNDSQFISPVVSTTAPNGQKFLTGFVLKTAGNRTFSVSDNAGSTSTSTVIGVALSAGRFVNLVISTNATSGATLSPTVRIIDDYANIDTASTSTIRITSSDTGATLPPDTALVAGQANLSLTLFDEGNQTVTAQSLNSVATSTTSTVAVSFSGTVLLRITVSTNAVAGTTFGSTVTVTDAFNNQYTPYGGTVTFASGDAQFVSPVVSTTVPGGQRFINGFVLKTAGNQTFSASDNVGSTSTSTVVAVALSAGRVLVLTAPATAASGATISPTIRMVDDFNNLDAASTSTIRMTSGDSAATLPPDTALVAGQATVSLILRTAGDQTVTVNSLNSVATAGSSTVTVSANVAPVGFGFTVPATISAGQAFTFTIESRDQFGNRSNYTGPGTLALTTGRFEIISENGSAPRAAPSLASAVAQATIQFVNGLWTGQVVLRGEVARPNFTVSVGAITGSTADSGIVISNDLPYMQDTIIYPNPFRPAQHGNTNIRFYDPSGGSMVRIVIYTFDWQKVREWNLDSTLMGTDVLKRLAWDGKDEHGTDVAPGIYLCVTEVSGSDKRSKLAVIR